MTDGAVRNEAGTLAYDRISIAVHWTTAALVVAQLCLGWIMNEVLGDHSPARPQVLWLHISVGLTILILTLARIGLRLARPPPALPPALPAWESALARASHLMFYMLLLGLPLTGWALVSVRSASLPLWGLPIPAIPGLHGLSHPARHALSHAHVYVMIWLLVVTLALHVLGALWHQFDGAPVLWRMGLGRRPLARPVQ